VDTLIKLYMNKTCLFIIVSFLILACQSEKENYIIKVSKNDFKKSLKIVGNEILKEDFNLNREIFVVDSLIILKTGSGKNYFNVYNKESFELLGSVGIRGEGPDEWQVINFTGQFDITNEGEIGMWVSNFKKGFIYKVNINETLRKKNPEPVIDKNFRIDGRRYPFFNPFYVSGETFVSKSWITEDEFVRIKSFEFSTGTVKKSGLFPVIQNIENLPVEVINTIYTSSFKKHPKKEIFGQALYFFNRIDIFDKDLKTLISIVDGETWKDFHYDAANIDFESDFLSDFQQFYSGLFLSQKYIYVLTAGEKDKSGSKHFRIFDYSGNPIVILNVSDEIYSFSVDENDDFLYAIDRENEKILRYSLKNILKN